MAARTSIREQIHAFLETLERRRVGPAEWDALLSRLTRAVGDAGRVNPRYVLEVLHQTDVEVDRTLGGLPLDLRGRVHTRSPEAAAESLLFASAEYTRAREARDAARAEDVRRAVRQAKDRLRLTLRRRNLREDTRREKQELLEWFLVWLENPGVFPAWLEAKRRRLTAPR